MDRVSASMSVKPSNPAETRTPVEPNRGPDERNRHQRGLERHGHLDGRDHAQRIVLSGCRIGVVRARVQSHIG